MPQSFLPPSTGSLGHFSPGRTPQSSSTASHTATPAMAVTGSSRSGGRFGRSSAVRYTPFPLGDWKERSIRPLPAVWRSAVTTVPSGAPSWASCLARMLVESSVSKHRSSRPTTAVLPRKLRISASLMASGTAARR